MRGIFRLLSRVCALPLLEFSADYDDLFSLQILLLLEKQLDSAFQFAFGFPSSAANINFYRTRSILAQYSQQNYSILVFSRIRSPL